MSVSSETATEALGAYLKKFPTVRRDGNGVLTGLYKATGRDGRPMREILAERTGIPCSVSGEDTIRAYPGPGIYKTNKAFGISFGTAYVQVTALARTPATLWEGAVRERDVVHASGRKLYAHRALLVRALETDDVVRAISEEAPRHDAIWDRLIVNEWRLIERALGWLRASTEYPDKEQIGRRVQKLAEMWEYDGWRAPVERVRIVRARQGRALPDVRPLWDLAPDSFQAIPPQEVIVRIPAAGEIRRLMGGLVSCADGVGDERCRDAVRHALVAYCTARLTGEATPKYKSWLTLVAEGALPVGLDAEGRLVVAV